MATTIAVAGTSFEHCEQTVEAARRDVPGVTAATADRGASHGSRAPTV